MSRILLVEDNKQIREAVSSYLKLEGFTVDEAFNLKKAEDLIKQHKPALVILDIMLPDGDGFLFAKKIKQTFKTPFIFLSAKTAESDRITGLELGADDYVSKPFSAKELVLRVKAVLKRTQNNTSQNPGKSQLKYTHGENQIEIDREVLKILVNSKEVDLTAAEWKILLYLVDNNFRVISRDELLKNCLDYNQGFSQRAIDTHIKNIRAKLQAEGWIETKRSFGYRFAGKEV